MTLDVEVLNRRKGMHEGVTDLDDGRKLPIWFSTRDDYLGRIGTGDTAAVAHTIIEFHMYIIVYPECWCTIDELGQSWAVKIVLIEENYIHVVELRGVNVGREFLQIFDTPYESKKSESREDSAFWWGQTSAFQVRARLRGSEFKEK